MGGAKFAGPPHGLRSNDWEIRWAVREVGDAVHSESNIKMTDLEKNLAKARLIITSACKMLQHARENAPRFGQERYAANADCYVLLADATKIFCQQVSARLGEPLDKRWCPALPELLIAHPEKCRETLAALEKPDFTGLSYFQFVAA